MRILVVIYEFPPIGGGGGHVARDILRELVKRDHEIHVLTARYKNQPRRENQEGIQVVRVSSARRSPYFADLTTMTGFVLAGTWAGWRYIQKWRPDIIHVHFAVPSGPVAWFLWRISGIPYVLTAHLGDVPKGVPEKTEKWFRWIYPFTPPIWRSAAQVVAVSEHTRQLALESYPVNIQVIPNGISLHGMTFADIQVNTPPVIIFAGRFVTQKNPLQVIETLAHLLETPWKCIMLGDGPLMADVLREIRLKNMEDRFFFPGWLTPEEVFGWLRQSDILFMPSLSEGMPVVGVKGLAAGLAFVAAQVGGLCELVKQGENGFLVTSTEPAGFTNAMKELLSNPPLLRKFRETSQVKAKSYDIKHVTESYEKIFYEVHQKSQSNFHRS